MNRLAVLAPLFFAAGTTVVVEQSPSPGVFRSAIDVTPVTVTVRDNNGHLVKYLERDAFEVYEDGLPQTVTQFTSERVPISLGVLLDTRMSGTSIE